MSTQTMTLGSFSTAARIGRTWFKFRSFSPLPFFFLLLVLTPSFRPNVFQMALSLFGIIAAEMLRIYAVGYAGSATRTRGDTVPGLVHAGPYRYVRNPLYLANIVMYSCAGLAFGFSGLSVLIFLASSVEYIFIVAFEEETLSLSFGDAYENYCSKVPRWIPSFSPLIESTGEAFSIQKALRSERSTFISLAMMALLFVLKKSL